MSKALERIEKFQEHLCSNRSFSEDKYGIKMISEDIFVTEVPESQDKALYEQVLTPDALAFVAEIATTFQAQIEEIFRLRKERRARVETSEEFPHFLASTKHIRDDPTWTIDPLPAALQDRRVDIGDVSPAETEFLLRSLNSGAQGIQVDFDDGHCPTWHNTLQGHANIIQAVRGTLTSGSLRICENPSLLIIRPRAWNMNENNIIVQGRVVPGAIVDFGLHLFHNGHFLYEQGRGPFLYLPKIECHQEARLWNEIFILTEKKLQIPMGSIKATVLIESIFAAFEMEEILYELRHHSSGLNCGMWDYTASIIMNFRLFSNFILPDRQQFVSMKSSFLQNYMELLIDTCHRRQAPATTGMVPFVLDQLPQDFSKEKAIERTIQGKKFEALSGSDGALVYDLKLVSYVQKVFVMASTKAIPILKKPFDAQYYEQKLLTLPQGFVTIKSVYFNLQVTFFYLLGWFQSKGTVLVNGCVEDSATAEISRTQLWQWIHHQVVLEDGTKQVTPGLIKSLLDQLVSKVQKVSKEKAIESLVALFVFQLVTMQEPPSFITTFLLEKDPLIRYVQQQFYHSLPPPPPPPHN